VAAAGYGDPLIRSIYTVAIVAHKVATSLIFVDEVCRNDNPVSIKTPSDGIDDMLTGSLPAY
jgi:hypothetical protein